MTAHSGIDWEMVAREAPLVVDFRNVVPGARRQGLEALTMARDGASVSIGVVGMNYWGPNLARNFDRLDGLPAGLGLRPRRGRARPAPRRLPGDAASPTRYEDLLEDPDLDAVVIATPVPTHAPLARLALEAGKDAFVEKPLALTAARRQRAGRPRRRARAAC